MHLLLSNFFFFLNIRNDSEKHQERVRTYCRSLRAIKDDTATAVETVAAVTFPGVVESFRPAKALP